MKTAIMFLADGFEECEGLLAADILIRAGVRVVMASVMGRKEIESTHGIHLFADCLAEEADYQAADMLVLPGGLPGTEHLRANTIVREQCLAFAADDRYVGAICAAPSVLADLGLLEGKPATCIPAFEERMGGAILNGRSVAVADNLITGQGLGAGIDFALKLAEVLTDRETAARISRAICYR